VAIGNDHIKNDAIDDRLDRHMAAAAAPAAPGPAANRSQYLQLFIDSGVVRDLQEFNGIQEEEFAATLAALLVQDAPAFLDDIQAEEISDVRQPQEQSLEEKIAHLRVPEGAVNVLEELETGRAMLGAHLQVYETEVKPRIRESRIRTRLM
jgi:hypothetical protein